MRLEQIRTPRAPDSTAKEVVCCAVLKQKDPLSTMFQRNSSGHRQMQQHQTRFSWKPLVILFLLALDVPIAALPVSMTNWSSLRQLIVVSSSGPLQKDVEIAPSISPFFPFLLGIHILLIMSVFARPLPLWPLSVLRQSNCGQQQQFAAKSQIIRSLWAALKIDAAESWEFILWILFPLIVLLLWFLTFSSFLVLKLMLLFLLRWQKGIQVTPEVTPRNVKILFQIAELYLLLFIIS